jgi:hypothetical protein
MEPMTMIVTRGAKRTNDRQDRPGSPRALFRFTRPEVQPVVQRALQVETKLPTLPFEALRLGRVSKPRIA